MRNASRSIFGILFEFRKRAVWLLNNMESLLRSHLNGGDWASEVMYYHPEESISIIKLIFEFLDLPI